MGPEPEYSRFPVDVARHERVCRLCQKEIDAGESYHDAGGNRTAHVTCAKQAAPEPVAESGDLASQRLYHGTKADLKPGDLIGPGYSSNYGSGKKAGYVYLTATLDAAAWGAELARGEGRGRIYIVKPAGPIEDDPNLTDKKFPGNPTRSYRSRDPIQVIRELTDWEGHASEELKAMKDNIERATQLGVEAIED